jgi:hypothetical protein
MADEKDAVTRLIYDARTAKEGADQFKAASQQVIADNRAVADSEEKTARTVEQSEAKKATARKTGAALAHSRANAQAVAAADAANVIGNSTDRVLIPRLSRQQQTLDRVMRSV